MFSSSKNKQKQQQQKHVTETSRVMFDEISGNHGPTKVKYNISYNKPPLEGPG